jgi:hypothetical protein
VRTRVDAGGISIAIDPAGDILLTGETINFGKPDAIEVTKMRPSPAPRSGLLRVRQLERSPLILRETSLWRGVGFPIAKLNSKGKVLFSSSLLPGDDATDAVADVFDNLLVTEDGINAQLNHDIIFTVRLK